MRWPASALALALAVSAAGCGGSGLPVPAEARGEWTTDDPRYEGRALRIGADSVRFYTGEGGFTAHAVRRVEVERGDDGARYELRYGERGAEYLLAFHLRRGRTLVLVNQPGLMWRREAEQLLRP